MRSLIFCFSLLLPFLVRGQCNDGPTITSSSVIGVLCFGLSDGSIDYNEAGGQAPLTYDWNDLSGNDDPRSRMNLTGGTYELTITDAIGCTYDTIFLVPEPDPVGINLTISDALCSGNADGSITAQAFGGTAAFIYVRNNGAIEPNFFTNELGSNGFAFFNMSLKEKSVEALRVFTGYGSGKETRY